MRKIQKIILRVAPSQFLWLALLFVVPSILSAQQTMDVETPESIQFMLTRWIDKNKTNTTTKAWRIQILSTDDRRKMEQTRTKFEQLYPSIPMSWKHVSPYYQVRVGAFKDKTDLFGLLSTLRVDFPSATPVLDDIEKLDLINFQYSSWQSSHE